MGEGEVSDPAGTPPFGRDAFSAGGMEPGIALVMYGIISRSTKTCFHHCRFLLTAPPIRLSLADPPIAFRNAHPGKKKSF